MTTGSYAEDNSLVVTDHFGETPMHRGTTRTWSGPDSDPPDAKFENPYTLFVGRTSNSIVTFQEYDPWEDEFNTRHVCSTRLSLPPIPPDLAELQSNDHNKMLNRLDNAIKMHDFNAGVTAGEMGETLKHIGDTTRAIARAVNRVKKGDFLGAKRALGVKKPKTIKASLHHAADSTSNRWLSLQLGWLPLYKDLESAGEALASLSVPRPKKFSSSIARGETHDTTTTTLGVSASVHIRNRRKITTTVAESQLNVPYYLGLDRPAGVAWELVPLSFVVDWVLPLGSYIDALGLSRVMRSARVTISESKETNVSIGGSRDDYQFTFTRKVNQPWPRPSLPNLKSLNEAKSWKRAATGIALLTQAFI